VWTLNAARDILSSKPISRNPMGTKPVCHKPRSAVGAAAARAGVPGEAPQGQRGGEKPAMMAARPPLPPSDTRLPRCRRAEACAVHQLSA